MIEPPDAFVMVRPVRTFTKKAKIAIKDSLELAFFPVFRTAEWLLSPGAFYFLLRPYYHTRAALNMRGRKTGAVPDFLRVLQDRQAMTEQRAGYYLNQILDYFPGRLTRTKWQSRCPIEGVEHLQTAQKAKRPVVLAFCHFGSYYLLRAWLRAAGFPAVVLMAGKTERRSRFRRFMDRFVPWPEIPPTVYQDHWHELAGHLKAGRPLLVAVDVPRGKQIELPFCEGWAFQMASGAVRLAQKHGADLMACSLIGEGPWKFRLKISPPVPKEFLQPDAGWAPAGKCLLDAMLSDFQAHPEQCTNDLVRCLKVVERRETVAAQG